MCNSINSHILDDNQGKPGRNQLFCSNFFYNLGLVLPSILALNSAMKVPESNLLIMGLKAAIP